MVGHVGRISCEASQRPELVLIFQWILSHCLKRYNRNYWFLQLDTAYAKSNKHSASGE